MSNDGVCRIALATPGLLNIARLPKVALRLEILTILAFSFLTIVYNLLHLKICQTKNLSNEKNTFNLIFLSPRHQLPTTLYIQILTIWLKLKAEKRHGDYSLSSLIIRLVTSHCLSISNDASLNGPRLFVNLTKAKAT